MELSTPGSDLQEHMSGQGSIINVYLYEKIRNNKWNMYLEPQGHYGLKEAFKKAGLAQEDFIEQVAGEPDPEEQD